MEQKPSIGRIVHYQSLGSPGGEYKPEPRAAIITAVVDEYSNVVSLCVLNPTGFYFIEKCQLVDPPQPGHWSWPPRV